MAIGILLILAAFAWLGYETRWLTIRLPYGAPAPQPQAVKVKPEPICLIPQYCERTRLQREWQQLAGNKHRHSDTWVYGTGYNTRRPTSYQAVAIGKQVITLNATLPNLHEIIAEVTRVATEKPRKASVKVAPFQSTFIEQVRIGSHHEYVKWNHETNEMDYSTKPKKGYCHRTENDYTTVYHDCLPGVEWLKAHEHDEYPETQIEISANGKSISVNGNYKAGMIRDFVKANK